MPTPIKIGLSAYQWPSVGPSGDITQLRNAIPLVKPIFRRFPYDMRIPAEKRDAAVERLLTDTTHLNVVLQPCIIGVPGSEFYHPRDVDHVDRIAAEAKKAAIRFKDRITVWQIGNEPNDDVPYDLYATWQFKVGLALRCGSNFITVIAAGLKGLPSNWRVGAKAGLPAAEYTRKALASEDGSRMRTMITWYAVHAYQESPVMNFHIVNALKSEVPGVRIVVSEMGFYEPEELTPEITAAWIKDTFLRLETLGVVEQVNWFGWQRHPEWKPPTYRGLIDERGMKLAQFSTFVTLASR